MGRPIFRDPARQAELEARGFTIVPILSEEEAAQALREVQALTPDDGYDVVPGAAAYHCTFLDTSHEYKAAVDELNRRWFEARTQELLEDCWMLTSNLYVKPPGTGRFEIHQNWPVTDDIRDTTLTLWCPFVPAGPHNGSIQVVPGSHKIVPDTFTVGAPKYFASFYDRLIERWLEPVHLRPGECILFDDGLLHWSDANGSDETRWSAQLVFMPREKTPVIYHYDADDEPPRLDRYEVDPSFFIDRGVEQLLAPDGLPFLGSQPAEHFDIDEETFAELMAEGPSTRALVYAGASVDEAWARAREIAAAGAARAARVDDPGHDVDPGPEPEPEPEPASEPAPAPGPAPDPAGPAAAARRRRWWPFGS